MIDSLKQSLTNWLRTKQERSNKCGIWPLEFSKSFVFTPACIKHDIAYSLLKQEVLAHGLDVFLKSSDNPRSEQLKMLWRDAAFRRRWVNANYRHRIAGADYEFSEAMKQITNQEPKLINKLGQAIVHSIFNYVLSEYAWRIWRDKVLEELEDELPL